MVVLQQMQKQRRQLVQIVGAKSQINEAVLLQNLLCHFGLLHHAAADSDDQMGLFFFQFLEPRHVAQGAPLGIIAHTAGVEDDKVRVAAVIRFCHAHLGKHARQLFAVMGIHLAAIGNDMIAARPPGMSSHRLHGRSLLCQRFRGYIYRGLLQEKHPFCCWLDWFTRRGIRCRRNACRAW